MHFKTNTIMDTLKRFKIQQNLLKTYVVLSGFFYATYCGLLCLGVREELSELIVLIFAFVLLCWASRSYRLCWLSKAFISYSFAVRVCIVMYVADLWGEWLDIAHYIMFGIGSILCLVFIINIKRIFQ